MNVARPHDVIDMIDTATTARTTLVTAARIRSLAVGGILVRTGMGGQLWSDWTAQLAMKSDET